jgi:TetR/AcrR family transcriptional repressor of nem operon
MRKADSDSPTRQKLLDAAQELMLVKGYTDTSIDEICQAAGLTKGSFFHYFEDKEHLGRQVVEHFHAAKRQLFRSASCHRQKDPLDRVFGFVDFVIEMSQSPMAAKGCLLGTFVQELSQTYPGMRSACAACFEESIGPFRRDLEEAKAKYAPQAPWNPHSLAEHLLAVIQGAIILAKAKQDQQVVADHVAHFKAYLQCVFGE